jgi:hypothetical protein
MSVFSLTEPSLELAIATALLNCQTPIMQDEESDTLMTSSTFLPLPIQDCALEIPPSLFSCVPIEPIALPERLEIARDVESLEDLSSIVIAPAEFAVPASKFWCPKFDFGCDEFDDVSTCGPLSGHSDGSQNSDCRVTWWKCLESGSVSARSTSSTASTEVPRSISTASVSSSRSSSISPRSCSRSQRFLHKAKDLLCEMVAVDNSKDICGASDVAVRPLQPQLKPLNGCMPRFPSCEIGSPKIASPVVMERIASKEVSSARDSAVPEELSQRESVIAVCNANASTGVGACANSALALSPVVSSQIQFCKLPQEMPEVQSVRQSTSGRFHACKPLLPLVSAQCSHHLILGV